MYGPFTGAYPEYMLRYAIRHNALRRWLTSTQQPNLHLPAMVEGFPWGFRGFSLRKRPAMWLCFRSSVSFLERLEISPSGKANSASICVL